MKIIYNKIFLEHNTGDHPENKDRLKFFFSLPDNKIPYGEEYLKLAHAKEHISHVKDMCNKGLSLDLDTPTCNKSYNVACYAVGATIMAAEKSGFALVRPPGHHATRYSSMGFCLFNNMAIAAKYLASNGKMVFIIDFDIHHGNGTQDIVIGDNKIVYFSTHQSPAYPGSGLKSEQNCINIPLKYGTNDEDYIKALENNLLPALERFNPDIIGLSAGFDSYIKDFDYMNPALGFKLTRKSYEKIKEIVKGYKVFAVLEGGYNPESIKEGVEVFTK